MKSQKIFDVYRDQLQLMAPITGDLELEVAKSYGIKLTSCKKFSNSNLLIRGCDEFKTNFKETSTGYTDYILRSISITTLGIFMHYRKHKTDYSGKIVCKRVKGLRLELEVPRHDLGKAQKYILEYDEDRVLGKLLRIWEYTGDLEKKLTMLEDGCFIVLKN